MSDKRQPSARKLTCVKPWGAGRTVGKGAVAKRWKETGWIMGKQNGLAPASHRMKMNVGDQTYVIESRPLGGLHEHRLYAYRVWCDGELVKDWTEGNMADFFGQLPTAGKS